MIFSATSNYKFFVRDYGVQQERLDKAMQRIASGQRFITPGEAPADLGISERFRAQIVNTEEASRVIQNAANLFQTSDAFMQTAHDILNRMSELSISAFDSSKNQGDRANLDLEFQQLKDELARVSESGKYNELQINGKTAVSVWDAFNEQIVYYQPDGTDKREVEYNMNISATSENGLKYFFQNNSSVTGDFTFSADGKSMFYYAQSTNLNTSVAVPTRNTLMKLDLASDTLNYLKLESGTTTAKVAAMTANTSNRFTTDEKAQIWTSYMTDASQLSIGLVRENEMTLDKGGAGSTNAWAGQVTLASTFGDFAVNKDSIYYIKSDGAGTEKTFVKRDLYDVNQTKILINDLSTNFGLTSGVSYAISNDGRYLAYEGNSTAGTAGHLFVIDTEEAKQGSLIVGTRANAIVGLGFDYNNNLYWTDTGSIQQKNSISKVSISRGSDGRPDFDNIRTLVNGNVGHFGAIDASVASTYGGGLSISAGSPGTNYQFQVGPDAGMKVEMTSGDIRLFTLGISDTDVRTMEGAEAAIADIEFAIGVVANQRAIVGSEVSRLSHTLSSNESYNANISSAESRLRDVNLAAETAELTSAQILSQGALQILQVSNQNRQSAMMLLQGL